MSKIIKPETGANDQDKLFSHYSDYLTKYRNLLTTKIFEKNEQIKNEFRNFGKINGLSVFSIPEALEAFEGEKLKLRLTFLHPQPDRAQAFLSIFFTSPKEFYLSIYHRKESHVEIYAGEKITPADVKEVKDLYEDLLISDVYISYYDKDRLTDSDDAVKYSNFIDIIEQLYSAPRKF